MIATISRWGNSLGIRIPKHALAEAHLEEGDQVDIVAQDGKLVMTRKERRPTLESLVYRITPENRHGEPFGSLVGKELW